MYDNVGECKYVYRHESGFDCGFELECNYEYDGKNKFECEFKFEFEYTYTNISARTSFKINSSM